MLYQRKVFTLPAAGHKTSDKNWDRAFLKPEQFEAKYGKDSYEEAQPDQN